MIDHRERKAAAEAILGIPLFRVIMAELEAAEINGAVGASYDDHEKRQSHMLAVKAIRKLLTRIESLANVDQFDGGISAPA